MLVKHDSEKKVEKKSQQDDKTTFKWKQLKSKALARRKEKLDVTKIDEKSPQALNKTSLYRLFYVKPQKVVLKTHFFNLSVN